MPSAVRVVPQGLDTEDKDGPDQAGDQPAMCIKICPREGVVGGAEQATMSQDLCRRRATDRAQSRELQQLHAFLQHH